MKMTRRQLTAVVSATAISVASAQTEQRPPAPPDELTAARERLKANSALLDRQQVPMAVEPAFQFKA
jgi:hypothetical protein